jgi:hypothetical protein
MNEMANDEIKNQEEQVDEMTTEKLNETNDGKEQSEEVTLDSLIHHSTTGSLTLSVTKTGFKFLVNSFKNKIEWTGPNDAYMLNIIAMSLNSILYGDKYKNASHDEKIEVDIPITVCRMMLYFQNRFSGKGQSSALDYYRYVFSTLGQAANQIKELDDKINELKEKEQASDSKEESK